MSDIQVDIAKMVESIITPLVEHPEEVKVTQTLTDDGDTLVEIAVNDDDAGKVIGRQGRVIKAVRTVARAAGSRHDLHVEVELID